VIRRNDTAECNQICTDAEIPAIEGMRPAAR
jgi:hypothetical protein